MAAVVLDLVRVTGTFVVPRRDGTMDLGARVLPTLLPFSIPIANDIGYDALSPFLGRAIRGQFQMC